MDRYQNYKDLKHHEKEGSDFVILKRDGKSGVVIMAIHGGGIEPGTMDIADAIANREHSFYSFKGIKKAGNSVLHLTASRFDEPAGLRCAQEAQLVISIHGCRGQGNIVLIGGLNKSMKARVQRALTETGFNAEICDETGIRGLRSDNICNRCRSNMGVQLEISRGLREKMFGNLTRRSLRNRSLIFYRFVDSVRKALQ